MDYEATPQENPLGEGKILVVDDEKDIVLIMKEFLEGLGYQVFSAYNGEEALGELKKEEIDLVLTDLYMPEMNGINLLREMKKRSISLPVVVITGYPSINVAVEAMKEGASDFVVKPVKLEQLELAIKKLIGKGKTPTGGSTEGGTGQGLNGTLNKKIKELFALYSISDALGQVLDPDNLFKKIVETAAEIAEAENSSLMILDRDCGELIIKAAVGLDKEMIEQTKVLLGKGIAGLAAKEAKPYLIRDFEKDFSYPKPPRPLYRPKSMISVPLMIKGRVFGVLNVTDKINGEAFNEEDFFLMQVLAQKVALNIENVLLYERNYQSILEAVKSLIMTINAKDSYTNAHSERVTQYSLNIASKLGCTQEEKDVINFAGFLHDIGKVGIPDSILLKPGRLTDEEFAIIKTHTITGENIVMPLGFLPQERVLIRFHHERIDGSGYPDGLQGDEVPLLACILAVADSYDAMTSDRPYRRAKSHAEAMAELESLSGIKYHEDVIRAFKKTFN